MAVGSVQDRAWAVDGERTYRVVAVDSRRCAQYPRGTFGRPSDRRRNSADGPRRAAARALPRMVPDPLQRRVRLGERPLSGGRAGRRPVRSPPAAGRAAAAPPPRKLPPLPPYWRVTGVAQADGLKVHEEPSLAGPGRACVRAAGRLHQARRRLSEAVVPGEVPDRRRRSGRLGGFQAPGSREWALRPLGRARVRKRWGHGRRWAERDRRRLRSGHSAFVHGLARSTTTAASRVSQQRAADISWPGAHPVTCRRYIAIASAALFLAVTLLPASEAIAQGSCSSSCRASYGNCYKKSQDRAKCQAQLQRCLEGCIQRRR